MNERKKVLVSLNGSYQTKDKEDDKMEIVFPGYWARKDDIRYIRFDEPAETPGDQPVHTMIRCREDMAEVIRTGAIRTRMLFEPGKKSECCYQTEIGELKLGIFTTGLELIEKEDRTDLLIRYTLDEGSGRSVDCRIDLTVREKVTLDV